MRVLTFNSHQPYLHLLATHLPWTLGVITPRYPSGKIRAWNPRIRPKPDNVLLYPSPEAALRDGTWNWILTHNVEDLLDVRSVPLPKILLVHGTLAGRILQDRSSIDRNVYLKNLQTLLDADRCRVIYISELKKEDWGIPGIVIRSAVDPAHYGKYRGDTSGILQVCNHIRSRGAMLGWDTHRTVCRDLPSLVLGENPGLPGSRTAADWDDLKECYRSYRVYLHTAVYPYEDGFNLALVEAMATGMPIASIGHPTSPIRDGVEGVCASTAGELREKVKRLLESPAESVRLGMAARERLKAEFPMERFIASWQAAAESLIRCGEPAIPPSR